MFKCTDYYMNQSIYMFKAEKAFKYNNVHCASFLIQSILKHSNQCILSSCNISHQVVHTPVSHKQAILSTKSNRVPPFHLMICNNN